MTSSPTFRPLSAALLAAALALAALPGCGDKPAPTPPDGKKDEPKADPKPADKGDPKPLDKGETKTTPVVGTEPKNLLGPVEPGAEKAAEAFLKELGQGTATAGALSTNLLKAVGKPLELPADTAQGYSADNATRWLKRAGEGRTFSLSLDRKQAGDAIYWHGALQGQPGVYALRLVKEGGGWKVDWLSLSSAGAKGGPPAGTADEAFQEFAVRAFAEVLADTTAMSDATRAPALAHALTADLRKAWAPPGAQDAAQGYDYSPGHLRLAAVKYAGGTQEFAVSRTGPLTFDVALTRPAGAKTLAVKLVKGTTPGEWLVTDVTEKG